MVHKKALYSRSQIVIENISSYLHKLRPELHVSNFRQSLENVVQKAAGIWCPISGLSGDTSLILSLLGVEHDEWSPLNFPETEHGGNHISQKISGENLLTVFPRIAAV